MSQEQKGTTLALKINKATKQVATQNSFTLMEGANRVYSNGNKPTPATLGAVNKAGDTMTGALQINGVHTNVAPATDQLRMSGYGVIGNRAAVYLHNSLASGVVKLGVGGKFGENVKLEVQSSKVMSNVNLYEGANRVYSNGNKPTPATLGAVNKAGDTLTGTLNYRMLSNQQTSNLDTCGDASGFSVFYGTSSATSKPTGQDHAVLTQSYSDIWQTQLASDWRTNKWYVRSQENGTWKPWTEVYTRLSKPTSAEIGALPLSGGTVTGNITTGTGLYFGTSTGYYYSPYKTGTVDGISTRGELISNANMLIHADKDGSGTAEGLFLRAGGGGANANELKIVSKTTSAGQDRTALKFNGNSVYHAGYLPITVGKKRIRVNGDKNTCYPVVISGTPQGYGLAKYNVSRGYNWTAPNDWNTSSHKGGLTLTWFWTGDGNWGGNSKYHKFLEFSETYTNMVGGHTSSTGGDIVWLRGGGADYDVWCDAGEITVNVVLGNYTAPDDTVYTPRAYNSTDAINARASITNGMRDISWTATDIRGSIDLNSYDRNGMYTVYNTTTMTNKPPTGFEYGTMLTIGADTTSNKFVGQLFIERATGRVITRGRNDGGGAWCSWNELYSERHKPTPAEIGAVATSEVNEGAGSWSGTINKIPRITSGGVLEVARYIDFHTTNSTADYDVRLNCLNANELQVEGGSLRSNYYESFAFASQKDTKAPYYNEYSTGGTSEYHPAWKQKGVRTSGSTWITSMGQLISGTDVSNTSLQMIKSDGTSRVWSFGNNGDFTSPGNIGAYSDERVKTDVKVIDNALDKVCQIRGITYKRTDIDDNTRHAGVIAQEIEKVLPEVVSTFENTSNGIKDFRSVSYGNISALLIEAIKELKASNDELRKEIEVLKNAA